MVDVMQRRAFAAFLERLAAGVYDVDDWGEYAVNLYHDEVLEECRRKCVRLALEARTLFPGTDEHRARLQAWADELRTSAAP